MGQKAILNTLRINHKNFVLNYNLQKNLNLSKIQFYLTKIFFCKNFVLDKNFLITSGSTLVYNTNVFVCSQPFSKYKKKILKKLKNLNTSNIVSKIFNRKFKLLKINLIKFKLKILNIYIKHELLIKFYFIFKNYINLFEKRFYAFIDFLKIITLFSTKHITLQSLILIFSKIFSRLHKRKHSKFLVFLQTLFNFYVNNNCFKGFKMIIKGKFSGKTMASTSCIIAGNISIQSLKKNIEYKSLHSYTPYGVYGIKLWVCN
jgi:hypothetical protein